MADRDYSPADLVKLQVELVEEMRALHHRDLRHVRLTMPQLKVLFALRRQGTAAAGELADLLGVSAPTVTDILDRMAGLGLVTRERGQHDRRVVYVRATPAGKQALADLLEERSALYRTIFQEMSEEERNTVGRGLETLLEAVRRWGQSHHAEDGTERQ